MKKRMSKILSGLIILTMIISSTGLAFAEKTDKSNNLSGAEVKSELTKLAEETIKAKQNDNKSFTPKKATEGNNFIITKINKGTDDELDAAKVSEIYYNTYDDIIPGGDTDYTFCGYSQAVKLNKGTVIMAGAIEGNNGEAYANYGLFKDKNMDYPVDKYKDVKYTDGAVSAVFSVPETGTYYIGAYSCIQDSSSTLYRFVGCVMSVSGLDRPLTSGSQIAVGQEKAQTNYFTFKATKTGYIRILTDTAVRFKLCNSNKTKSLSDLSPSTTEIVYGVKKGTTYKVRVDAPSNKYGNYVLKLTNSGITESSGSSKSKAKTIYRGKSKAKKGTIIAGSSTSDWYKFKLAKKSTVKVTLEGATNNGIKLYVYKGSKLIKSYTLKRIHESIYIKSGNKWSAGTYYIKIARANSYSSGWYKCYWNYK